MKGVAAFFVFLFIIPVGHILTAAALKLSVVGQIAIILSGLVAAVGIMCVTRRVTSDAWETFWGLVAGVLLWACLFEMGFRIMVKTFGMNEVKAIELTIVPIIPLVLYLLFNEHVRCTFFAGLRSLLYTQRKPCTEIPVDRWCPRTAVKVFMVMWIGHVILYYAYDPAVFGERGLFVKFFFAFCICAGGYMFYRLFRAKDMGFAFRQAVPTVITIWCCVETWGRWKAYPDPFAIIDLFFVVCLAAAVVLLAFFVIKSKKNNA